MSSPSPSSLSRRSLLVAGGVAALASADLSPAAAAPRPAAVSAAAAVDPVMHLLRRATFGPTPALVAEVRKVGIAAWLDAQLAPASKVPDVEVDALMRRWPRLSWKTWECRDRLAGTPFTSDVLLDTLEAHIARAVFSRRQVFEVAVDFWTNHLVVPVPVGEVYDCAHLYQRDVIRRHALGKYSDMLAAAARHPAMLKILDNADSSKKAPNENYGRELLELHTVGIGNYTEADVRQSALALTGLSADVESGAYEFKPMRRWVGPLKVMGWTSPNASAEGGEAVALDYLTYLAKHPATAKRLATKLAIRFVSDTPPATLVTKLAQVYLANDTAIAPVLKALFTSPEFAASGVQKVRTPYEDALATVRILGLRPEPAGPVGVGGVSAAPGLRSLFWETRTMGQAPMGWPAPNGYPDVAAAWSGAASTLARWNFHLSVAGGWAAKPMPRPDLRTLLLPGTLPATYGAFVDRVASNLLVGPLTAPQRAAVCTFLDHAPADPLKDGSAALTWRLPYVVALLLDSPDFATR